MQDKQFLDSHEEEFQLSSPSHSWEMIGNAKISYVSWNKLNTTRDKLALVWPQTDCNLFV